VRYIDGDVDLPGAIDIDVESFATTLGYQLSFPVEISGGTMIPSVNVAWEHEFEDNFTPAFGPTTTIDEDVLVAGAGIGWYLDSGWNFVINYRGRFGEDAESHYGGLKIGKTF
jgi:outer membrane autotransporter protein